MSFFNHGPLRDANIALVCTLQETTTTKNLTYLNEGRKQTIMRSFVGRDILSLLEIDI